LDERRLILVVAACATSLQISCGRADGCCEDFVHSHHALGHGVRLALVNVIGGADR
jgi:hypothetical protein